MTSKIALLATCFLAGLMTVSGIDGTDDRPVLPQDTLPAKVEIGRLPVGFESLPAAPENNPTTQAKVDLGRRLFFDPILSANGTVSCASCHQPEYGFASPEDLPVGFEGERGRRNSPTIINRAFGTAFSWDGRDGSLEQQVLGPLTSKGEMGGNLAGVIQNLRENEAYVAQFAKVFSDEVGSEAADKVITEQTLAFALASFERTLVSGNSPVDRFRGSDYDALSKTARQGLWIFESRGGCWKCHSGANFSDEDFHNTGVAYGTEKRDEGRFEHTGDEADKFKFKTPTLRDIEHTAPYMHDGSVKTLREVVEFYNRGGNPDDPLLDKKMKPLNLTEAEIGFLVDFLKALSGDGVPVKVD